MADYFYRVNPTLVVEGLSVGMGRGEEWYTKAVGMYLSRAIMRPHALRVVLDRVLGSEKARGIETSSLQYRAVLSLLLGSSAAFNHVVKLVTACPSSVIAEVPL